MLRTMSAMAACATMAVIAGCGGGGDDQAGYTVDTGAAQKGPLAQGSAVFVSELASDTLQPNGKTYPLSTLSDLGTFSTTGIKFGSDYLATLAQGYYFNEITGSQSSDFVDLRGLSQLGAGGDTVINVNALSSMAVNRIIKLATQSSPLAFAAARAQTQKELLASFYLYNGTSILSGATAGGVQQPANLTALDLSKSRAGDQILAAISGMVMTAGANGNGVNTLLSQIAVDAADDGSLNNSPKYRTAVSDLLCFAADATDPSVVAANLNRVYGTKYTGTDLSQWIDTSGCVDQVINKYKFTSSNISVGAESKSPAYIVGPDDVGKCFSAGNASVGATANIYYKGSSTAVVGTKKVNLGDSLTIGLTAASSGSFTGYIRRSAPNASGACPTTLPTSGLVRTQKYSIQVGNSQTMVSTLADGDNAGTANGAGATARFNRLRAVAVSAAGHLYATDYEKQMIRKVTPNGNVSTLAGRGDAGEYDGVGTNASFFYPVGIALDAAGNVYVADENQSIRKINQAGVVSTLLAFNPQNDQPWSIDNVASATFMGGQAVAVDGSGNVYVIENMPEGGARIRKITAAGVVSTLAGGNRYGAADGGGPVATFSSPGGIAADASGNLYVADTGNYKIRKIRPDGVVSTLAGSGAGGDVNGPGTQARFGQLAGIAVDAAGNVYVADVAARKIKKVTPQGVVSTLAGVGVGNFDGAGAGTGFDSPTGVAVDAAGNVYVADYRKVRKITQQ